MLRHAVVVLVRDVMSSARKKTEDYVEPSHSSLLGKNDELQWCGAKCVVASTSSRSGLAPITQQYLLLTICVIHKR